VVKQLPERQEQIATAKVQRGDVVIRAFTRGELHAVRSVMLLAPNLNGTVQVTRLAPVGSLAHEKDLVVEYDDSERHAALDEARLGVEQVDEQIKGQKATHGHHPSQDALALLASALQCPAGRVECAENPILDVIDAKKNLLALDEPSARIDTTGNRRQVAAGPVRFAARGLAGATRNRSLLNDAGPAAHRADQEPGADHRPGFHPAEPRRQFQFRPADARHSRRRHAPAGHAGGTTCWTFPKWKYGPRWANSTAPT
jgi:hypothetical protein